MQCRGRCNACGAAIPYHACRNCMQAASSCLSCASCTRAYDAKVVHKPPLAASHVLQNSERAKFQRAETHGYTFTKCHAATYTVLLLHTCILTATPTQALCMPPIHATARYHHLNCEAVAPRVRTQCLVVVNGRKVAAGMVKIVLVVLASGGLL